MWMRYNPRGSNAAPSTENTGYREINFISLKQYADDDAANDDLQTIDSGYRRKFIDVAVHIHKSPLHRP